MTIVAKEDDILIEKLMLGSWETNAYIVTCRKTHDSVLIDAPGEADLIMEKLAGTNPRYILMTHSHVDHVGALVPLHSRLSVPLAAHALDAAILPYPPEKLLTDGDVIPLGNLSVEVLHTPGHTPGSLCFRIGKHLISGDTVFPGGPGHTAGPDNFKQIIKSIEEKVLALPDDTRIYPGHGDSTVLKAVKEEFAVFASRPHAINLCGDVLWLSS